MAEAAIITAVFNQSVEIGANLIVKTGSRLYHLKENLEWIEGKMRHFKSCLKDAESKPDGRREVTNLVNDMRDLALDIEDILDTYIPEMASHKGKGTFRRVKHAACILCYGATANSFALEIEKIKRRAQELNLLEKDVKLMLKGVGKTTIGKKIYREMRNEFTSSAIVYVSNEPRVQELLLEIAKQVGLEKEKMEENLEVNLHSLLNEKKCLIFLDDIWSTEAWDKLKNIIPFHSRNGSKIIITSRYANVGRYIGGESSLIELRLLDQVKSWELFSELIRSSSENTNERFPWIELEGIARKIVERCGGLPLAIEVAVGMLRQRRRNKREWNMVLDSLSTSAGNICSKILSLSYKDLPTDLRPFLLYFGLFPEDKEIFASELVNAWVAEKLIQDNGTRKPDDIVADKLELLSDRNLIQVSRRNLDGSIKSCRIHDLLHVLCIETSKENNFFYTCHNIHPTSFSTLRRLTIENTSQYSFSNSKTPKLRSFLCFSNSGEERSSLPNEIGNLSSLTYLKLSGRFESMPSSIRNLKKLVTLDMKDANFRYIVPRNIFKMKYLKHLLFCTFWFVSQRFENLYVRNKDFLPNIETLDNVPYDILKASSLQKLSNLRKLDIRYARDQHIDVISGTTPISEKLQYLRLSYHNFERLKLSHYDHLAELYLQVSLNLAPVILDTIEFPPNLINLTLEYMTFTEDPMKVLKGLPRFEILALKYCGYNGSFALDFSGENSFPELQVFAVMTYRDIPKLIVDQTGMPKLYKFVFNRHDEDLKVPERLRKIMFVKPRMSR